MKHIKYGLTVPLIFMVLAFQSSYADSMRCGNKLVSIGDRKAEVLIKCGEPMLRETIAIEQKAEYAELALKYPLLYKHGLLKNEEGMVIGKDTSVTYSVDQWTYHLGQGKFLRTLIFKGGQLVAIDHGERM